MTHAEELLSEKGKLRLDLAILTGEHEALLARIEAELKDRDSLRERLKELVEVLQDWGHGMDCGCEDVDKPCPNCECGANEMFEARDRARSALQRGGSKP